MINDVSASLTVKSQFRLAAKALCGAHGNTQRSDQNKVKSSAQVESFVSQQAVSQNSGGLKPEGSRPYRIVIRFTKTERSMIVGQAQAASLTVSQYVRLLLLNNPRLDPQRNRLMLRANYQLSRHGNNLNQIARKLNAEAIESNEACCHALQTLLSKLSLAYKALREALANSNPPY